MYFNVIILESTKTNNFFVVKPRIITLEMYFWQMVGNVIIQEPSIANNFFVVKPRIITLEAIFE